jgi:hypothetical protein
LLVSNYYWLISRCDSRAAIKTVSLTTIFDPKLVRKLLVLLVRILSVIFSTLSPRVIIELEKGISMNFLIDAAVHKVQAIGAAKIPCPDAAGFNEAGILQSVEYRLAQLGKELTPV